MEITKIKKRDGRIADFDPGKITLAIFKAAQSVGGKDMAIAEELGAKVLEELKKSGKKVPSVEEVQDAVEKVLIEEGHAKTAKAYILYRQKRKELREAKSMIGVTDDIDLTINAVKVLEERYLARDENRRVVETPGGMFRRVARNIASADLQYGKSKEEVKKTEDVFYNMMVNLEFLPNSPTLMNAGRELQQLSACFVLPVDDSMEGIFDTVKNTALIHQSGGGTGFSFSRLRPRGDVVQSTGGVASGPLSFMKVFNASTEVIKQGGKRRGANMGILRVDHPDILDFIVAKEREGSLNNFNISVGLTEKFMNAVEKDGEYDLINPRGKEPIKKLSARRVFDLIVTMAWKNGEPGIIFIDRLNRDNPTPAVGEIESTNPCGEQPLLPYESCNLGSINLSKAVKDGKVDWDKLRQTVRTAVHFLDNVIDKSKFPLKRITEMVRANRKIGLGVMGWADMIIQLGVSYNSKEGVELAEKVMKFVRDEGRKMSEELAKEKGTFPNFKDSMYDKDGKHFKGLDMKLRNATITTIAPTGTIGIIAGCSSGVEPLFAISYIRKTPQFELLEVNPLFEKMAREEGIYSEDMMRNIAKQGSIHHIEGIPAKLKKVFVTAHDITPEDHVRMQAAFQESVDNAVSKTVNFPFEASTRDVEEVYVLAYKLGCKGVTIYRDGSRSEQVLNIDQTPTKKKDAPMKKVKGKVTVDAEYSGGCPTCHL
ncbi:vitamin B12-dependent ribonucleotide reductase [Candidatus Woesearchaeota archaeon]|nr:vitamin B12-dependent ribonucleotide reductase [Candidatus Woesearchaeota archaeon]